MIAIPAPLGIQRRHEQIGAVELLQEQLAVAIADEGRRTKDEGRLVFVVRLWSLLVGFQVVLSRIEHSPPKIKVPGTEYQG